MGNCMRISSNRVLAEETDDPIDMESSPPAPAAKQSGDLLTDAKKKKKKKKKRVRFALQEDAARKSKSGVVRIRAVVTQEELKQILEYKSSNSNFSSVEELLREMRRRGRSVSQVNDDKIWSPELEAIPEDL